MPKPSGMSEEETSALYWLKRPTLVDSSSENVNDGPRTRPLKKSSFFDPDLHRI